MTDPIKREVDRYLKEVIKKADETFIKELAKWINNDVLQGYDKNNEDIIEQSIRNYFRYKTKGDWR